MTDQEFFDWFVGNLELMMKLGIMHPNSEWGKIVKLSLIANIPHFEKMEARIKMLEDEVERLRAISESR